MAQQKAQDFDDLLSGKKQAAAEKNLQTLFREFYDEAKKVDPKSYVNSARSSIGSLSGTLEKRREKLRKMKEDALNIDKDKTKTTEKATDKATDKATETPDPEKAAEDKK